MRGHKAPAAAAAAAKRQPPRNVCRLKSVFPYDMIGEPPPPSRAGFGIKSCALRMIGEIRKRNNKTMPTSLEVLTFFPDGGAPEATVIPQEALSGRWLSVCAEILNTFGPSFKHNMGSALSHFDIHMAGPIGRLLLNGTPCYEFAVSCGMATEQDVAAVKHFSEMVRKAWQITGASAGKDVQFFLNRQDAKPSMLLFDYCRMEMDDEQKLGLAQLGIHLAKAYLDYCNNKGQSPTTAASAEP